MTMEQVGKVGEGLIMEGFVSELNTPRNWEPVEVQEDRGDVVAGAGVCKKTCSRVFNVL